MNIQEQLRTRFSLDDVQIGVLLSKFSDLEIEKALKSTIFNNRELLKMNLRLIKKYYNSKL